MINKETFRISLYFLISYFLLNERSATHAAIYARGNQPWIARDPGGVACQAPPTAHPKKHDLYTTHFLCGPPNTYNNVCSFCSAFNSISRPPPFFIFAHYSANACIGVTFIFSAITPRNLRGLAVTLLSRLFRRLLHRAPCVVGTSL